jgi:hypothetical protein
MKARAALLILIGTVLLGALLPFAHSLGGVDRPEGVAPENWVPISNSLGLVLVEKPATQMPGIVVAPQALLFAPARMGYFMVKRGGTWRRLVVVEPMRGPGDSASLWPAR